MKMCSDQKVFLQKLETDQSKRNKRELVLAGKMPKRHHILAGGWGEEKLGIKRTHSLEKSQGVWVTKGECSRQVANQKSGGEKGLRFGQSFSGGGVGSAREHDYSWGAGETKG